MYEPGVKLTFSFKKKKKSFSDDVVHARHSQNQVRGLFRCEWSSSGLDLPACLFGAHPAQQEYINSMLLLITMVKHIHVFLKNEISRSK